MEDTPKQTKVRKSLVGGLGYEAMIARGHLIEFVSPQGRDGD